MSPPQPKPPNGRRRAKGSLLPPGPASPLATRVPGRFPSGRPGPGRLPTRPEHVSIATQRDFLDNHTSKGRGQADKEFECG